MPLLTSLDGKVYELDEAILEKYRIADEDVQKLGLMPPLPTPPAEPPPVAGAAKQEVARTLTGSAPSRPAGRDSEVTPS